MNVRIIVITIPLIILGICTESANGQFKNMDAQNMDSITKMSASEIALKIKSGEFSTQQVTEAYIRNI